MTALHHNPGQGEPAPDANELITIFDQLFGHADNTRLVRGQDEPLYLPAANHDDYNQVIFAHGFFSSALHEISHWCLAGQARRKLVDYGYWYTPDGRTEQQQTEFEKVEVKPQALEWIFTKACKLTFRVSVDNLNSGSGDSSHFKRSVHQQVLRYCDEGIPARAHQFRAALSAYYQTPASLLTSQFALTELS